MTSPNRIHEPQLVRYCGVMTAVEEVVCDLLCSRMTTDQVFRWLERRMQIGRFTPK